MGQAQLKPNRDCDDIIQERMTMLKHLVFNDQFIHTNVQFNVLSTTPIPNKLRLLSSHKGIYIAGGALVRLVLGHYDPNVHDIDLFVVGHSEKVREQRLRKFIKAHDGQVTRNSRSHVNIVQEDGTKLQLIMTRFDTIQQVLRDFDFSICRLWINKSHQLQALPSAAFSLQFGLNYVSSQTIISKQRIQKYEELFSLTTHIDPDCHVVDYQYNPTPTSIPIDEPFETIDQGHVTFF